IAGPSAVFKYKNHSFGFLTEINVFADVLGVPKKLVDRMHNELTSGQKLQVDQPVNHKDILNVRLNIKQQAWMSIGFNYSYIWAFKRRKSLSVGVTYKLLHSMGGSHIQLDAGGFKEENKHSISFKSPGISYTNMMPRKNRF